MRIRRTIMTRTSHRTSVPHASARLAVLGMALAVTCTAAPARATDPSAERVRAARQHHVFHTPSGGTVTGATMSGQVVVLHLWATWCAPCRKELPKLDALNAELSKANGRVLAVSIDIDPRNVERFMAQQRLKLPVVVDGPDGLARELDVPAIPYTVVLNRNGEVVSQIAGSGDAMLDATAATARRLLAEKPMADRTPNAEETR
jgi:thiol-disulfide isomerase/thioredoxin